MAGKYYEELDIGAMFRTSTGAHRHRNGQPFIQYSDTQSAVLTSRCRVRRLNLARQDPCQQHLHTGFCGRCVGRRHYTWHHAWQLGF